MPKSKRDKKGKSVTFSIITVFEFITFLNKLYLQIKFVTFQCLSQKPIKKVSY